MATRRAQLTSTVDRAASMHGQGLAGALFDAAPGALVGAEVDGEVVAWNPAAERLLGWPAEEAVGRALDDLVAVPAHRTRLRRALAAAIAADGKPGQAALDVDAVRREGGGLPLEVRLSTAELDGRLLVCASLSDASAHRRLAESHGRLAAIIEASDAAVFGVDINGTVSTWNQAAERIYGFSAEEIVGRPGLLLIPPELRASFDIYQRLAAGEHIREYETQRWTKDGRRVDVSVNVRPILDAYGRVVGGSAVVTDIGEKVRARAELAEAQQRFATAFDDAPIGMALVAPDGRYMKVNRALCDITGYPARVLESTTFQAITHPDDLEADLQLAGEMLDGRRRTYELEKRYRHARGHAIWVMLSVSIVRDPEGAPLHLVAQIQDIDERKEAAATLERYAAELRILAREDPLTGLANRREVEAALERHLGQVGERCPVGLVLVDLDGFKEINDAHGHLHGDRVLREVADALSALDRDGVIVGRLGGDEFALVAPGADPGRAKELAAAAQRAIVDLGAGIHASVGAATSPADGDEGQALLQAADQRLYETKSVRSGRLRVVARLVADEIEHARLQTVSEHLEQTATGIEALMRALDARDHYTGGHSHRVLEIARAVGVGLGLGESAIVEVSHVALLHDIGKLGIPDSLLNKTGPLDQREWEVMRQHPVIGARIVESVEKLRHLAPAIRAEHERWDGGGYPDGLRGTEIPLASRIVFACDAYHAMITDRPYRPARDATAARRELQRGSGIQFDPAVIDVLLSVLHDRERGRGGSSGAPRAPSA